MIPVTQTKVVVRNSAGETVVPGNCYAAAMASMLELPIEAVPNVEVLFPVDDFLWDRVMDDFLAYKGYELVYNSDFKYWHPEMIEGASAEVIEMMKQITADKFYFASGDSPRGVKHICIYKNGELVHDPHPTREGLLKIDYFQILTKIVL